MNVSKLAELVIEDDETYCPDHSDGRDDAQSDKQRIRNRFERDANNLAIGGRLSRFQPLLVLEPSHVVRLSVVESEKIVFAIDHLFDLCPRDTIAGV